MFETEGTSTVQLPISFQTVSGPHGSYNCSIVDKSSANGIFRPYSVLFENQNSLQFVVLTNVSLEFSQSSMHDRIFYLKLFIIEQNGIQQTFELKSVVDLDPFSWNTCIVSLGGYEVHNEAFPPLEPNLTCDKDRCTLNSILKLGVTP